MKNFLILFLCLISINSYSYYQSETVDKIIEEATDNSQLELLAHELFDLIGPRLVGTPQMKNAHDWAKEKYETWSHVRWTCWEQRFHIRSLLVLERETPWFSGRTWTDPGR